MNTFYITKKIMSKKYESVNIDNKKNDIQKDNVIKLKKVKPLCSYKNIGVVFAYEMSFSFL